MASRTRTPTLALTALSMCLTLAVMGTAGRSLHVYYHQRSTNPWLLPLWPDHFDSRGLQTLIGTSGAIFVLNAILAIALLVPALLENAIVLASAFFSTLIAILALALPTTINNHAPHKATLQTWTCHWSAIEILQGESPPDQFQGLCTKTRFAYWTTIPILAIQLLLLAVGIFNLFARPSQAQRHRESEKEQAMQLRDVSSTRDGSSYDGRRIYPDQHGYYGAAQ